MGNNFAFNVALSHWREVMAERGPDYLREKRDDMLFSVQLDPIALPAIQMVLEEEGEQ